MPDVHEQKTNRGDVFAESYIFTSFSHYHLVDFARTIRLEHQLGVLGAKMRSAALHATCWVSNRVFTFREVVLEHF